MQSIGERLEEARKRKGISIREAAEATKIRGDYLHKYESNQFDIKLPEIYVRGFLRTYANYLKLPADKIINDYNALGLGEAKSGRGLNREVYGRMDLSISSTKPEKDSKEPGPAEEPAPAEPPSPRNPATFVPRGNGGLPIDRDLLIKGGALVAITVVVILVAIWAFSGRGSNKDAANSANAGLASSDTVWVKPRTGEPTLSLVALNSVTVTATSKADGTILYQGTIPRGDTRTIPRRGALHLVADPNQNLALEIAGTRYSYPDTKGADIAAP
jgi:transcriptional regulator with XRE-family HTH domain